jgi:hypothetical protein
MSNIGPALPPHLLRKREPSAEVEEGPSLAPSAEAAEEAGPALPPHILAARRAKAAQAQAGSSVQASSSTSASESKKTYGPTLPGNTPTAPARPTYDEEDDDDDDVGPRPEMAYQGDRAGDGVREFLEREERLNKLREVRCPISMISPSIRPY